jgi:hypothetical protein
LAVAVSYTWDEGEEGYKNAERPAVFVRKVGDEIKVCFLPCVGSGVTNVNLTHSLRGGTIDAVGTLSTAVYMCMGATLLIL